MSGRKTERHLADPLGRVVLIGMMGSGKTTVGLKLAARLRWQYIDNDELISDVGGIEPEGLTTAVDIEELHRAESAALVAALAVRARCVVSAAAGVVEDRRCRTLLEAEPRVICLRARPDTLLRRIGSGQGRRTDATDARWLGIHDRERDRLYRDLAGLIVEVDRTGPDAVVEQILAHVASPSAT
jgi:shikimate kinase